MLKIFFTSFILYLFFSFCFYYLMVDKVDHQKIQGSVVVSALISAVSMAIRTTVERHDSDEVKGCRSRQSSLSVLGTGS